MTDTNTQEAQPVNGTNHQITSVNDFGQLIMAWHGNVVARVEHLKTVPDGTVVSIGDDQQITLTGEALSGYKLGLELALYNLGELPFEHVQEEVAESATEASEVTEATEDKPDDTPVH